MVRSPDGNTDFFKVAHTVLQGDIQAPYLFVVSIDYMLGVSSHSPKELGFTLSTPRS